MDFFKSAQKISSDKMLLALTTWNTDSVWGAILLEAKLQSVK
jgi:hypothetical protein